MQYARSVMPDARTPPDTFPVRWFHCIVFPRRSCSLPLARSWAPSAAQSWKRPPLPPHNSPIPQFVCVGVTSLPQGGAHRCRTCGRMPPSRAFRTRQTHFGSCSSSPAHGKRHSDGRVGSRSASADSSRWRERRHQRVHQQDGGHHRAVSDGSARRAVSPIMDSAPSHKAKEGDGVVQ